MCKAFWTQIFDHILGKKSNLEEGANERMMLGLTEARLDVVCMHENVRL